MKVPGPTPHASLMERPQPPPPRAPAPEGGFAQIYKTWFHEVCRWIRARGGPESELEDLAQEIFLVVRRRLPDFDGANLPAWLYRITANTVSDHRRCAWFRRVFRGPRDAPLSVLTQPGDDPAERAERRQTQAHLSRVLQRLSERQREVLVLFEIEELSMKDVALAIGCPEKTAYGRLYAAREALKRAFLKLDPEGGPT